MSNVVVVVDMQGDFIDGSLAVPGARQIIPTAQAVIDNADVVAFTRDWHPENHISFSDNPKFVDKSWPPHCVQGTGGAALDPSLASAEHAHAVFSKGTDPEVEQYSGAQGVNASGQTLVDFLYSYGASNVYVVGLALDYCVMNTAIDLAQLFPTTVLLNATRAVAPDTGAHAIVQMLHNGVMMDLARTDIDAA